MLQFKQQNEEHRYHNISVCCCCFEHSKLLSIWHSFSLLSVSHCSSVLIRRVWAVVVFMCACALTEKKNIARHLFLVSFWERSAYKLDCKQHIHFNVGLASKTRCLAEHTAHIINWQLRTHEYRMCVSACLCTKILFSAYDQLKRYENALAVAKIPKIVRADS